MVLAEPMSNEDRLELVRLQNLESCFISLRDSGPSTVADIAAETGLSRPTIKDRLQDLIALGLVAEVGRVVRRGQSSGRPASRFAVSPRAGYVIGLELGKHHERIVVADMANVVRARYVFTADDRTSVTDRMRSLVTRVADIRSAHADLGPLLRVGAAVPGALAPDGLMTRSPIFKEWTGQNVADAFASVFDVPVVLQNDLNAAALAEHRHGAAADASDVVLALVWHQVSAGLIIDGDVRVGRHARAGEMSQLVASADEQMLQRWPSMPDFLETLSAAEAGDQRSRELVEEFALAAGAQIATLLIAVDPDVVVLYGPASANDYVAELVANAVHTAVSPPEDTPLLQAQLGADAAATGVLIAALESAHTQFFGETGTPIQQLIEAGAPATR